MKTLTLELADRRCPVHIGRGLLAGAGGYLRECLPGRRAVVVTDDVVAPLYLDALLRALASPPAFDTAVIEIAHGEEHKNLATFERICTRMLECGVGRDGAVVALGGGVVGDTAGFAAAAYQRGIAFAQVPTTLLAQVDSAVGGKTGVNHALGKNMIGAFHQPCCVVSDLDTLDTLPARHYTAGLAEVVKYGLILDASFFDWCERNLDALLARDEQALTFAVHRSCEIKAAVVADDERERSGRRALLNLGHTFGHAIETGLGHGRWLHGEAVACGLVLSARLSARLGLMDGAEARRVEGVVARLGLPVEKPAALDAAGMIKRMSLDKKNLGGRTRLVLMRGAGAAFISDDTDPAELRAVLN